MKIYNGYEIISDIASQTKTMVRIDEIVSQEINDYIYKYNIYYEHSYNVARVRINEIASQVINNYIYSNNKYCEHG